MKKFENKWWDGEYREADWDSWETDPILKDRFANDDNRQLKILGKIYSISNNGTFTLYWPNGLKRYEWDYKDGKRADGKSYGWWPNGKIKIIRNWVEQKHFGLQQEFYTNGKIWLEEMITVNKDCGEFIEYNADGTIKQKGRFNLDYRVTEDYGASISQPLWHDDEDVLVTKTTGYPDKLGL
jgi:hypothetical protein|tara:strand:- start:1211 stop:1756 length:546 start_codon:yes stop_codon:yes gene_type:complete